MRLIALTRPVPDGLGACELTHVPRTPIDLDRARAQHAAYERALESLGCVIHRVAAAHDHPDSVFIEDTAVALDEVAILTRPGAASRRGETAGVASILSRYRELEALTEPATLDGGDVLRLGRTLHVGVGGRTNDAGLEQLAAIVRKRGYGVQAVPVTGCLHLKSAVTELLPGVVLLNPDWVDAAAFDGYRVLEVDPAEPGAANVLRIEDTILCAAAFPRTAARIAGEGLSVRRLDVSELAKAEGALTCCSVIFTSTAQTSAQSQAS